MPEDEYSEAIEELKRIAGPEHGGQAKLARQLGVRPQRLYDWLSGKREPRVRTWFKIQAFLKKQR
jgi:hypothetical protein